MSDLSKLSRAAMMVVLMAVSAHIQIPIGLVPVTLQTMVCLVAGRLLGAKWGGMAMLAYIMLGLLGLPVFSGGGGLTYILSPSFGYIVGFVGAAIFTGFVGGKSSSFKGDFLMVTMALFIIYLFGTIHLFFSFTVIQEIPMNFLDLLKIGVVPFLLQDYLTSFLGMRLFSRIHQLTSGPVKT